MLTRFVRSNPVEYEKIKARAKRYWVFGDRASRRVSQLISTAHQLYCEDFVFIHIPKCGGTSIERALGIPLLNHDTALERYRKLGQKRWQQRTRFTVVRNPYHRMASLFFYWESVKCCEPEPLQRQFTNWMRYVNGQLAERHPNRHLQSQVWWSSNEAGQCMMDIVCRLETIDQDIRTVSRRISRPIDVPKVKANRLGINYRHVFSSESEELVWRLYHEDFQRFDYARGEAI